MDYNIYNFSKESNFLVTGGAGFIGSNLVERILDLGYGAIVLDDFSTGKEENIKEFYNHPKFELILGDIRDLPKCMNACQGVDYVLHQAAIGSVPRSIEDPRYTNDVNITGTLNMLIAAKENKVKRFVYASSSSVYGDEPNLPKVEKKIGNPLSPYGISKLVGELYAKNFYDLFQVPTIGLRYFNVFGKKQDPNSQYAAVIPIFIKQLLNNSHPIIYGDGLQSRDFTYIDNVVDSNLKACLAGAEALGDVFNIAYGERTYLNDLYGLLCQAFEQDIKANYDEKREGDIKHSVADITKAKEILKYEPSYDLRDGLKLTINWYKTNIESR